MSHRRRYSLDRLLVSLLPSRIRRDHGREVLEHLEWMRTHKAKEMGTLRFWLFVWGDFLKVIVGGHPRLAWLGVLLLLGPALYLLAEVTQPALLDSVASVSIVVGGAEGEGKTVFRASATRGQLAVREESGRLRTVSWGEDIEAPAELVLQGGVARARFTSQPGSPGLKLEARSLTSKLEARGRRVLLERTPVRVGVRVGGLAWLPGPLS